MAQRCIGVDIGGTKVATAVLDGSTLSTPKAVPTQISSTTALLDQLTDVILEQAAGDTTALVGIGCPSVIDFATGTARSSVNIPLHGVPLREALGERTGLEVVVDNDATVAALAEATDDATGEVVVDTLAMLTVGTGVGGGIIIGGRIYRGATGAAAEIGHMIIAANCAKGAPAGGDFPHPASLEANAAGRVLDALGRDRGYADGPAVVAAAQEGHQDAIDTLALLGSRLGVGIANLINIFDPQEVVVGGGAGSAAGDLILQPAIAAAWPLVLPGIGTETTIRLARHAGSAGVRGAALLARTEISDRAFP